MRIRGMGGQAAAWFGCVEVLQSEESFHVVLSQFPACFALKKIWPCDNLVDLDR